MSNRIFTLSFLWNNGSKHELQFIKPETVEANNIRGASEKANALIVKRYPVLR